MLEANCEELTTFDFRKVRDCQGLVAYVCSNDDSRKPWLGPALRGCCGKLYTKVIATRPPVFRALACEQCSTSGELRVLLWIGEDPRNLPLDESNNSGS